MDFLQSSFSGFFAAKLSRMAVTSTACAGAAAGEEAVAEAAGVVGTKTWQKPPGLLEWSASQLQQLRSEKQLRERQGLPTGLVGDS
jgi:hypothetical protein